MSLHFSRDTKVYVEALGTGGSPVTATSWEIPVLDGFSLSQATNSSEITLNEAGTQSRRTRLLFNDSLAPVEWSFSTYARPFLGAGSPADYATARVHAVEEVLWAMFVGLAGTDGDDGWVAPQNIPGTGISYTGTSNMIIDLTTSNQSYYPEGFNIYFSFSDTSASKNAYKITKAVVNSVTLDFDLEGLATLTWSGFGSLLQDQQGISPQTPTSFITEGVTDTGAFIRNRISDVTLSRTDSPAETYNIILTGGSITMENNINYLTPEEIGSVNQPLGNVTGARSISGNMTAYLDTTVSPSYSAELLADLVADTTTVRNVFALNIIVGGTGNTPRVDFAFPTAHLEIPTHSIEDVVSVDIAFHGQPSGGNVNNLDEATITYYAS
jgi:hypothetical protein